LHSKRAVGGKVRHHEHPALQDGVAADGNVEGKFARADADLRLEPLPPVRDQVHDRDRRLEDHRGELGNVVEGRFPLGIEDVVTVQRSQPIGFGKGEVGRFLLQGRLRHRLTSSRQGRERTLGGAPPRPQLESRQSRTGQARNACSWPHSPGLRRL
jgi:hypothetical protein